MTDVQIDFEAGTIEVMDYLKIKKYDLETLQYIGTENLNNLPGDKNFRNFARIGGALYLWTNLPPNQQVGAEDLGDHHLVKIFDGQVSYFVKKQYGVINGQIFHPTPNKDEYNLPPVVGSTDIMAVNKDSVFTKYRFNYGSKGIPLIELSRFWENN